jgi:hypothetical protein
MAKYGVSDCTTATTAVPDRPSAWVSVITPTNATTSHETKSMMLARGPP